MRVSSKKGFILMLVIVSLSILILSASVIVTIGCGELMTTRARNDLVSAYYVAMSGCERMYARQKTLTSLSTPINGTISVESNIIGTYSAAAYNYSYDENEKSGEFYIVSTGTVNGRTATATVKLGYWVDYDGPLALGAHGAVTLTSGSTSAKIKMEGPVASYETVTVTPGGNVDISGDPDIIDGADVPEVSFFDTATESLLTILKAADADGDGAVTLVEAQAADAAAGNTEVETAFNIVNAYSPSDTTVDGKDAFYYYYTTYLNLPGTLYYKGDQSFDSNDINDSVPMIFVDGNCEITDNDGATTDHTVVVTGDLTLHQPTNDSGDSNTYVVYGDVTTDGEMGHGGGTKGDLIIFANGDITKLGGGKMNASFYANGALTINTGTGRGNKHLMLSRLTGDDLPAGLPPNYPTNMTSGFTVKNQSNYPPVWQRN